MNKKKQEGPAISPFLAAMAKYHIPNTGLDSSNSLNL